MTIGIAKHRLHTHDVLGGGGGGGDKTLAMYATTVSSGSSVVSTGSRSTAKAKASAAAKPSSPSSAGAAKDHAGASSTALHMGTPPHPVAEFLFQLTKMLTDDNSQYIEWKSASIFVHDPPGLEKNILPKYFRHANYSSFQRQMNYFGFRKIAGKGKMAPCSYVNEAAKEDISSLLFIKRKKVGISSAAAKLITQQNRLNRSMGVGAGVGELGVVGMNPLLAQSMMTGGLNPGAAMNSPRLLGAGVGAGNLMGASAASLNEAARLREQNVLAQLQHAHASAVTSTPSSGLIAGMGGIPGINQAIQHQAIQNKQLVGGLGAGILTSDQGHIRLLANEQGNIHANALHAADYGNSADASLLLQQAAASGLTGVGLPQGIGGPVVRDTARIDSASNLRALINQQISMFNNPSSGSSTLTSLASTVPASSIHGAQAATTQLASAAVASLSAAGSASQGIPYAWNEMLQRLGTGVPGADAPSVVPAASIRQLEQQLIQGGASAATAGPTPAGQAFGVFGVGGAPRFAL